MKKPKSKNPEKLTIEKIKNSEKSENCKVRKQKTQGNYK